MRRCLLTENPGASFSTMNALMPKCLASLLVLAKTTVTSAIGPLVMNILAPFRMYVSPFLTAVVWIEAASEPALGSVRPMAPIHSPVASLGRYFSLCASVPCWRIVSPQR